MNREDVINLNKTIETKVEAIYGSRIDNSDDAEKFHHLNYLYGYNHCIDKCLDELNNNACGITSGSIYCYDSGYMSLAELKAIRDKLDYTIQHYYELLYEAMLKDNEDIDTVITNYNATHKKQIKIN